MWPDRAKGLFPWLKMTFSQPWKMCFSLTISCPVTALKYRLTCLNAKQQVALTASKWGKLGKFTNSHLKVLETVLPDGNVGENNSSIVVTMALPSNSSSHTTVTWLSTWTASWDSTSSRPLENDWTDFQHVRTSRWIWVIDQPRPVNMDGFWPSSFLACSWTETESRSTNTLKTNEVHMQSAWLNMLGQKRIFKTLFSCGTQRVIPLK